MRTGRGRRCVIILLAMVPVFVASMGMCGCRSSDRSKEVEVPRENPALEDAIVFVRDSDVWIIKPDGSGETRLTVSPEPKAFPRLSPDGRYVVFTSFLSGEDNTGGASIKRVSLGGTGTERAVTTLTKGFAPAYLPDGRIIFVRAGTREAGNSIYAWDDIFVMATEGGEERRLTDYSSINDSEAGLRILYLSPSPDGSEIAFVRGRRPDARWVSIVNSDGGETRYLGAPALEPNSSGRGLADGSIALASLDKVVLSHGNLNRGNDQADHHVFLLDTSRANETLLSSGADDLNPTLSPDGNHIAYETAGSIVTAKESGMDPEPLIRGIMPSWGRAIKLASQEQPGAGRIAFVRDNNIWISGPDHGGERRLTCESEPPRAAEPGSYDYIDWGGLAFSPDGSQLAAWRVGSDVAPALVSIDVADGRQTDLGQEYKSAWQGAGMYPWLGNIAWATENTLYCTAGSLNSVLGKVHVVKLDFASGTLTDIEAWARDPALSPDGRTLAYVSAPPEYRGDEIPWENSSPGDLVLMILEGGRKITVSSNVIEAVFTPAGDRLVAVYWNDPDTDLRLLDLEGNTLSKLDTVGPDYLMGHPSVSPDGRQAVYHVGERIRLGAPTVNSLVVVELGEGSFSAQEWGRGRFPAWR